MSAIHNADVSRAPEAGAALLGRSAALAAFQNAAVADRLEQRFKMTHLSDIIAKSTGVSSLAGAIAKFSAAQTRPMLHTSLSQNVASTIRLANFDSGIASVASAYLDSVRAARTMVGLLGGPERVREDAERTLSSAAMASLGDIRKSLDELGAARDSALADVARTYAENQRRLRELATANIGISGLRLSELFSIGIGETPSIRDMQLASASTAVANIVADRAALFENTMLAGGVMAYARVQSALWHGPNALLRGVSFAPSRRLDAYLSSLGVRPLARRANLAGAASFAVSGLMAGEALLTTDMDLDELEVLGADADEDIASPWRQGPAGLQVELYRELSRIDPVIPELLKGAWVDIVGDGPAAVTKAATCLVEALDVTLRGLCKGADVSAWLMEQGLRGDRYVAKNGRPTRAARATFALRMRSERDRRLVRAMEDGLVKQLASLMSAVEGTKHEPIVISVAASSIRSLAVSTESVLVQLLGL